VHAAVAHPAATVLLLRDGPRGVEVYLQRRPRRLGFAGGLWVFPGGRVDDADRDPAIDEHWSGPPPAAWAERLGVDVSTARGYVVAACRETLEEAGVLLGRPAPPPRSLAAAREHLLSGSRHLAQVLGDLGVRLDTGPLRYWAWWVTPEGEPRRYDTRFFLAPLPHGAAVSAHTGEVIEELWVSAPLPDSLEGAGERQRAGGRGLEGAGERQRAGGRGLEGAGERQRAGGRGLEMLPPTYYTLRDAVGFRRTAEIIAVGRDRIVDRIQPVLDGGDILLPWGDRYRVRSRTPGRETR
jgi:8-oxo-dGTP pyrophosphatase MutT (NUDIX family)